MKKVIFIGNSQIGALKAGWDEISEARETLAFEAYFAGVREQVFFHSKLKDSFFYFHKDLAERHNSPLMFSWDHRNSSIDLSIFDKIIIAAGPNRHYLPLYVDRSKRFFPNLSLALIEEIILRGRLSNESVIDRTAPVIFDLMRALPSKIIYLGSALPSESIKDQLIYPEWEPDEILDLQHKIKKTCSKINSDKEHPTFVSPKQALRDQLMSFTKHQYMKEGLRYDGNINGDPFHANSSYGSAIIRSIKDLLSE